MVKRVLVLVDVQVDFTTGRLGSEKAAKVSHDIMDYVRNHMNDYDLVIATMDTHSVDEFKIKETVEGDKIPMHCIAGSPGHALVGDLAEMVDAMPEKSTFMADDYAFTNAVEEFSGADGLIDDPEQIDVCGFCTDICVVSNVLQLRRTFPKSRIVVIEDLCAGTSIARHDAALDVMRSHLVYVKMAEEVSKLNNLDR